MDLRTQHGGRVTVLVVGGTGESYAGDRRTRPSGLLADVTACLDDRFVARWIGYPASYGPAPHADGMSYTRSLAVGVHALRAALRGTTGPVMMIGYSQGAVVVRTVLHELARYHDFALARVMAAGFVADPHQPPGAVDGCDGWGVAGPGPELPTGLPVYWVGAPEDVICNAQADSFVRDIADLTSAMSLHRVSDWMGRLWITLRHNSFQNADRTSFGFAQMRRDLTRLTTTGREVRGYLPAALRWHGLVIRNRLGGRHTSYASEPYRRSSRTDPDTTGCQALAAWLQVCATFSTIGSVEQAGEEAYGIAG